MVPEVDEESTESSVIDLDSDLDLGILFRGNDQDQATPLTNNVNTSVSLQDVSGDDSGTSSDESVDQSSVQVRSRRGRPIRKPKHLQDYC